MAELDEVVQQALVHAVVDSAYGVGLVDEHARFLYVNPAGCEILGQEPEQLLEHHELVTALTTRAETQPTTLADRLDRNSYSRTAAITRPDGAIRQIDATLTRVHVDDRDLLAVMFRDVTHARRLERWAEAFARITSTMASAGGAEAILTELSRGVVESAGITACAAILFDPATARLRVVGAHGLPAHYGRHVEATLTQDRDLPAVRAFRTGEPVVIAATEDAVLTADASLAHEANWETIACIPMRVGGRVVGVLKTFLQATLRPERDLLAFLARMGDQAAVCAENARLFAEANEASRRQKALAQAGVTLASELSLPAALATIVRLACDVADARYGALGVLGSDGRLEDFITHGVTDEQRAAIGELPVGRGLLGALVSDARPVRLRSIQDDPRSEGFPPNHPPMTSFLGVPVMVGGHVYGNLYLTEKRGAPQFSEADERAVATLASQAGATIENARLFSEAQDRLTLEERTRLARELHDSVSQALFAMTLETGAAQLAIKEPDADLAALSSRLERLRELTEGALAEMRALIFELRPDAIQEEGLVAAIRKHAEGIAAREDLDTTVSAPEDRVSLPPDVEEQLYRLAQEALANVTRHARASRLHIRITAPNGDAVVLEIEDDGVGFDPSTPRPGHLGLRSMTQRAESLGGQLHVASSPGTGTLVRAVIPTGRSDP
jgi:PAS domain S-box-containing protein